MLARLVISGRGRGGFPDTLAHTKRESEAYSFVFCVPCSHADVSLPPIPAAAHDLRK